MEQESFEDEEAAAALNRDFICIKVDKEERPDIDAVYMGVCQALTGSGGWPLTVFLTPEQSPFYAGTYFPKHRRYGQPGLLELLSAVAESWKSRRNQLTETGREIAAALSREETGERFSADEHTVEKAEAQLEKSFDRRYGGFGRPPKFPMPHNLLFLLRCHVLEVGKDPLGQVEQSLKAMYRGGLFDHIGGGFSRYSTDEKWLAPHFEKMLYDNALLTMAYLECYQITGNPLYRGVAEKTLRYIHREMTSPEGGFYSAQDADSDGEEGKFYTFTPEEIRQVLGRDDGCSFCAQYDITPGGNFEGKSIPNLLRQSDPSLPDGRAESWLDALHTYRAGRHRLHKDDKILTSWNALMIASYAKAYRILGESQYLERARRAYGFVTQRLTGPDGGLPISYREGRVKGVGLLDDYVFLAWACLELYESTFQARYLEHAHHLMETVLARFSSSSGGFYLSPEEGEPLLFRPKEQFDGAVPSGNSVAAWCLVRLAALTGETRWREAADRQLVSFGGVFRQQPTAVTFALLALMQAVYPSRELVCAVPEEAERERLALELGALPHPQTAVLVKSPADQDALAMIAPFTKDYPIPRDGRSRFYFCQNRRCEAPRTDFETIKEKLR